MQGRAKAGAMDEYKFNKLRNEIGWARLRELAPGFHLPEAPFFKRLYFADLPRAWLSQTVDEVVPEFWKVAGERFLFLSRIAEEAGGDDGVIDLVVYAHRIEEGELWKGRRRDEGGVPVMLLWGVVAPGGRWQLDIVGIREYVEGTFHELVQRLREAGEPLVRQSPKVGENRKEPADRHAFLWEQRRDIVNEYYRRKKEEKISQAQFAEPKGISGRTLRRWIKEFPVDTDGHGQQA